MSGNGQFERSGHLRLREEFCHSFPWKNVRLTRDEFRQWAPSEYNRAQHQVTIDKSA